jgi:ribosomal-protein-alanine N-acetyltransferase
VSTDWALEPFRWWHIDDVLVLEDDLFAPDCWSAELFWSELAQQAAGRRHYVVASDGTGIVAYAGLATGTDDAYIQTLGVAPRVQGRGLGAVLLADLLAEADRAGAQRVGLEVRTDNVPAHRLYERAGFRVVGLRRGYYQPSGGDAHVMMREAGRG